jgi:hypothetical protein
MEIKNMSAATAYPKDTKTPQRSFLMQKRPVFFAMLFLGMALCFIGCATTAESTKDAVYELSTDGFTATIRGDTLTITLTDPPDSKLLDLGDYGITSVPPGLKVFVEEPGDSRFILVYVSKTNSSSRYGILYANQSGSFTEGNTTSTCSQGKGWYITGDTEARLMSAENNYNPFPDTHQWAVRNKRNGRIVWQQN